VQRKGRAADNTTKQGERLKAGDWTLPPAADPLGIIGLHRVIPPANNHRLEHSTKSDREFHPSSVCAEQLASATLPISYTNQSGLRQMNGEWPVRWHCISHVFGLLQLNYVIGLAVT
jgi:hypothetical protein